MLLRSESASIEFNVILKHKSVVVRSRLRQEMASGFLQKKRLKQKRSNISPRAPADDFSIDSDSRSIAES